MNRIRALAAAAGLILGTWDGEARAEVVTFEFQGAVTELDVNLGAFGPVFGVSVGDPIAGRFSYDTGPGNPDQVPADPTIGGYNALSLLVDGSPFVLSNPRIRILHIPPPTLPTDPPDLGRDEFLIFAEHPNYPLGVRLTLRGEFEDAFTDDSLPVDLDLSDFQTRTVAGVIATSLGGVETTDDRGDLETLTRQVSVPQPASVIVVAVGALGLLLRGRGRSTR